MRELVQGSVKPPLIFNSIFRRTPISIYPTEALQQMEAANLPQLTRRENEILQLVALGKGNKEIAQGLHISVTTTQNHLQNLYKKLQVRNRTEAAQKYHSQAQPLPENSGPGFQTHYRSP